MTDVERTEKLLHLISSHLSSRQDCRRVQYKVTVVDDAVSIVPHIQVYKNRYCRRAVDLLDVVDHVINYHSDSGHLVDGTYIYKLSVDAKQRKWTRER